MHYYSELYILKSWYMIQVSYTSIIYTRTKIKLACKLRCGKIYIPRDVQIEELKYLSTQSNKKTTSMWKSCMLALYIKPHWPIVKYNMQILELMSCPTDVKTETYLSVYTVSLLGRAYVCTALGKTKFWIVIAVHMHYNTTSNTITCACTLMFSKPSRNI